MKSLTHLNILLNDKQKTGKETFYKEFQLSDIETQYASSGILIWHILEDRIFMSEGFCRLMGMSKAGIFNLQLLLMSQSGNEFRSYLRNILDQVCNNEMETSSFKTKIPGIENEVYGSVQLFDREDLAISDLLLICWKS